MKLFLIMILLGAAGLFAGCGDSTSPSSPQPITVFAAASLQETLTDIARVWRDQTGCNVRLQFEASSTLARQIRHGARADVFVSAAPEWVDEITPVERFDWLSNRLVCVARQATMPLDIRSLSSLALANEQVPAGAYAKAALAYLKIPLPKRIVYGASVRDVLSKVASGGAEAGIVYATDARVNSDLKVIFTFPADSHPKIIYTVGLLRSEGERFASALREPWALDIARRHGFQEVN